MTTRSRGSDADSRDRRGAPDRHEHRPGVALCLSGGGFRAAVFHLGALRRLNELGVLGKLDVISGVSGGSIIAAHLATRLTPWPKPGAYVADWKDRIAKPFRAIVRRDICTLPILSRFWPINWTKTAAGALSLARQYERCLTNATLGTLPERPRFVFCATDMIFGIRWEFSRNRIGSHKAGYAATPSDYPIALAVAASSCFPPAFAPLPVGIPAEQFEGGRHPDAEQRMRFLKRMRVADGGLFDNLGIDAIRKFDTILVSDGGTPFAAIDRLAPVMRLARYSSILQKQVVALRKQQLIRDYRRGEKHGAYWGIASAVLRYELEHLGGYAKPLAMNQIARIRTDMNSFTDEECQVLENHGYLLAEAAMRKHSAELIARDCALEIPYPEMMDAERAARVLKNSHKRFTARRLSGFVPRR